MFLPNNKFDCKSFPLVAKDYLPSKRADNPHFIISILSLASYNLLSVMTGDDTQHQFAEIFHPFKYPDYIVYQYIQKDKAGTRQVECAFEKSEFSDSEWTTISKAVRDRRAYINGVIKSLPSVIELSYGRLH